MNDNIEKAINALNEADAVLIGASNGLSISEGFNIFADNDMFRSQFGDFREKYGIRSVLDGIFTRNMSREDYVAFASRLVNLWYDDYQPTQVMMNLNAVVSSKPYFVLTTNADEHLEKAGFDKEKVWEIEGTFRDLIPGNPPEDKQAALNAFLQKYNDKRIVILELGIGSRNRIIKLPLMQLAHRFPKATYITLNLTHEIYVPDEIAGKSIAIPGDIGMTLSKISEYITR